MINSDSDPESLLVSDSKLGLGIPDDLGLGIHDEHGLGESINPDFNLAFLQVLDSESMINSDLDPESLLVSDSQLGLGIPADLGLRIHEPRLGLGIPAGLRVAIHELRLGTRNP
jgi:hypothetical protein